MKIESFVYSTLQAKVFNKDVLPLPVGPSIAVNDPVFISPFKFLRIYCYYPFFLTEKFIFLKNK